MKKKILFILSLATLAFVSCDKNDDNDGYADYLVAKPLVISKAEFANSVDIIAPRPIDESGKCIPTKTTFL